VENFELNWGGVEQKLKWDGYPGERSSMVEGREIPRWSGNRRGPASPTPGGTTPCLDLAFPPLSFPRPSNLGGPPYLGLGTPSYLNRRPTWKRVTG
jgi:hypothetical protein